MILWSSGKYKSSGYGDLKENLNPESLAESAVRKIVRAIINEELEEVRGGGNYGMITINTRGGGGERNVKLAYAPDTLDSRNELRLKRSGDLIWDEAAKKLFVSQRLYNNLSKLSPGNATLQGIVRDAFGEQGKNRNKIRTIIKDLYPVFSQRNGTLSNPNPELENSGTWISPINFSVERATSDSEKGYYRSGELLFFPYAKKDKTPKVSSSEEEVTETLKESIEKELAAINKEAEAETMQIKLDKINDAIEKRKSQLTKLDEDEDMKNLTDKKKVKELEKDIKKLEQAKSKVEKLMSKGKGKKKEVIEDGAEDPMMDEDMMGEINMHEEDTFNEGAMDDAIAAAEKKVDQLKIQSATAEKELATKKEQEAKASQAG